MNKVPALIRLAANAEDEATGKARIIIRYTKVGGIPAELSLPRQMSQYAPAVYDAMIEHNAEIPVASDSTRAQIAAVISGTPEATHLHMARLGWNHDHTAFALPNTVIGGEDSKRALKPPLWIGDRHHAHCESRGTLESWQTNVGMLARLSSPCILAVCDALAAPALDLIGFGSFGHNLYGRSKAGKTTALMVGASVGGIGRESDLLNWGASASARIESGPLHRDQLMPLNEVGLLGGSKRTAYPHVRETIYRLCEGRERLKNTASVFAKSRVSSEFKLVFFSTAEHSFDDYARFKGEDRDEGEYARCLDIPINLPGRRTIIDFFPKSVEKSRRRRWADDKVIAMREGISRNHGVALKVYIEHLIGNRAEVPKKIRSLMAEFMADPDFPTVRGALAHAARNIALGYAAGMIGRDAGVITWSQKRIRDGLMRCLRRAIVAAGNQETLVTAGKKDLRKFLATKAVRQRKGATPTRETATGYWEAIDDVRVYVIHAATFRKIFASNPSRYDAILAWLQDGGHLTAKASKGGSTPKDWAVTTPRWPDGTNVRSIIFRDPFKKD